MLLSITEASKDLGLENYQVYYLIKCRYITAIQVGRVWRILPESLKNCQKTIPENLFIKLNKQSKIKRKKAA